VVIGGAKLHSNPEISLVPQSLNEFMPTSSCMSDLNRWYRHQLPCSLKLKIIKASICSEQLFWSKETKGATPSPFHTHTHTHTHTNKM
jgi:hypothetical protein